MKKKILKMAEAIDTVLGKSHRVTIPNAKRYVTRGILRDHSIRDSTHISYNDWETAVALIRQRRANALEKPEPAQKRAIPRSTLWKQQYLSSLERVFANGYLNPSEFELRKQLLETHPYRDAFFTALNNL